MEHLSNVMLIESEVKRREQEAQLARDRDGNWLPSRPVAWRAYLVVAIVVIGLIAWWII
jgi:hypothetical protein